MGAQRARKPGTANPALLQRSLPGRCHSGRDVASLFLDTGENFCSKTEAALLVLLEGADFICNRAWQSACFGTPVSHGDGTMKQAKASSSKVPVATSGTVAPPERRGSWEEAAKKGPLGSHLSPRGRNLCTGPGLHPWCDVCITSQPPIKAQHGDILSFFLPDPSKNKLLQGQ